jgi:hypothetical protein
MGLLHQGRLEVDSLPIGLLLMSWLDFPSLGGGLDVVLQGAV